MYPDPRIKAFVQDNFTAVRVHARNDADEFKRLGARFEAQWTPTTLIVDPAGHERHRIEGFLPANDFLGQLMLGLAHSAFARGRFDEAERWYREVLNKHADTDAAPEALYWAGVARYKAKGDAAALAETADQFGRRFQDTAWAKKASVWAKPANV